MGGGASGSAGFPGSREQAGGRERETRVTPERDKESSEDAGPRDRVLSLKHTGRQRF